MNYYDKYQNLKNKFVVNYVFSNLETEEYLSKIFSIQYEFETMSIEEEMYRKFNRVLKFFNTYRIEAYFLELKYADIITCDFECFKKFKNVLGIDITKYPILEIEKSILYKFKHFLEIFEESDVPVEFRKTRKQKIDEFKKYLKKEELAIDYLALFAQIKEQIERNCHITMY